MVNLLKFPSFHPDKPIYLPEVFSTAMVNGPPAMEIYEKDHKYLTESFYLLHNYRHQIFVLMSGSLIFTLGIKKKYGKFYKITSFASVDITVDFGL